MTQPRFYVFIAMLCVVIIFFTTNGHAKTGEYVLAQKTLNRWVDSIIMDGNLISEVVGVPLSNLLLYAYREGIFVPIRFQIDEMTDGGDWIFPEGPFPNRDLGNNKFDIWDKLLFMADDTGDRVVKDAWTQGYTRGVEIEIIDPLTKEKGWCYLLYFASNPPARCALPDYARFNYETNYEESDYYLVDNIITKDENRTTYYRWLAIPKQAGGNGRSYVDRMKIRTTVKVLFSAITVKLTEEQIKSNVLAYKKGPIRVNKRVEQYVLLPGGIKAMRAVTDIIKYRNTGTCPSVFQVPFRMDRLVSSFTIRFGTDYNENAFGARTYNSSNPQGFLVDGKMDATEKEFNPAFDSWRLITGNFGTFMTRTIPTPEVNKNVNITMGLIDDITQDYPPEEYPGSIGFLWQDWDIAHAPKGKYLMFLDFAWIPNYKPGDEMRYVNYIDNPIKIRVANKETVNNVLLVAELGKKYQ